jgi:hypothetical protein
MRRPLSERLAFEEAAAMREKAGEERKERVKKLIRDGETTTVIRARLGVSLDYIWKVRREMDNG